MKGTVSDKQGDRSAHSLGESRQRHGDKLLLPVRSLCRKVSRCAVTVFSFKEFEQRLDVEAKERRKVIKHY